MSKDEGFNFVELMQQRVADGSIGAPSVRGMGPAGTARAIRMYLRSPKLLEKFANAASEADFSRVLNAKTHELKLKLPGGDQFRKKNGKQEKIGTWGERWGVARKCLNIFLYECINNRWLCKQYPGLAKLEPWLEVPLDSYVGSALHERGAQSAWVNVIDLTPDLSLEYQEFARKLAAEKKINRVHLDLKFYNERADD